MTQSTSPTSQTSDLLSRLAEAQREASAQEWYGLGVLLNEAETAIRRLEQAKGGDVNADPTGSNPSTKSIPATSLGVTAEASEIEELCKELESPVDELTVGSTTETRKFYNQLHLKAASLIRRLVAERDQWQERESETQEALQAIGEDFGAHGGERRTDAVRRLLTEATARATDAEAEVERLRAENAELKAWKKRRQEEDEDEADRREIW